MMTSLLTREERQAAVLDGLLPDDVLTDDDLQDLQERVFNAIMKKLAAASGIVLVKQKTRKNPS